MAALRDRVGQTLTILLALVAVLLLLACVNMAGIMLAQAAGRDRGDGIAVWSRREPRKTDPAGADRIVPAFLGGTVLDWWLPGNSHAAEDP